MTGGLFSDAGNMAVVQYCAHIICAQCYVRAVHAFVVYTCLGVAKKVGGRLTGGEGRYGKLMYKREEWLRVGVEEFNTIKRRESTQLG